MSKETKKTTNAKEKRTAKPQASARQMSASPEQMQAARSKAQTLQTIEQNEMLRKARFDGLSKQIDSSMLWISELQEKNKNGEVSDEQFLEVVRNQIQAALLYSAM